MIFDHVPKFLKAFFGPALYRFHGDSTTQAFFYQVSGGEGIASTILNFQTSIFNWTKWVLAFYILTKQDYQLVILKNNAKIATAFAIIYILGWTARGIARSSNPQYKIFLNALISGDKNLIRKYDFDMKFWPVDYDATTPSSSKLNLANPPAAETNNFLYTFLGQSLGRMMVMPGSLGIINSQVGPQLLQFRAKMIEQKNGNRIRIKVNEEVSLDTMVFDRRNDNSITGNNKATLVICSEGNAGFYEVGTPSAPLGLGYSVLGWNHPGFAGSTGYPFVKNERESIKAILEYAVNELKFDKIVTYGWSIGGYVTAVAGNVLDKDGNRVVKAMVLDATFDHIFPLAGSALPSWFLPIAHGVIAQEWDLNVSRELVQFDGPVQFYRRKKDEIIAPGGPNRPDTNRINFLIYDYLAEKFPDHDLTNVKSLIELKSKPDEDEVMKFIRKRFVDLNLGHQDPMPNPYFHVPTE